MTIKHKILLNYIKDLSIETPDAESLIFARENISKYTLKLDLTSKPLKNKMIEVDTKLTYEDKVNKKKTYFEMIYATVVRVEEEKLKQEDVRKFILCDLQIKIYPQIENTFLEILKLSGFPNLKLNTKIDFNKLYNERKN
ncbi:MAG: protein-export chaperone SecB [Candidatus Pelagibacter sp.]|tara:strand:+ start:10 stop:429 length:420 start_codon:yes stop_codon:yes gene_type:complete